MDREKARARWRRYEATHRAERNKPRGNSRERSRRYFERHPERLRRTRCKSEARRRRDPAQRLADAVGRKLRHIIRGVKSDISLLGYSRDQFKHHIESLFLPGMSWDNYGEWHIDHKRPRASFRLPDEMLECWSLSNLRPLWAADNLSQRHRK